jgi:hypothetical protein
MARRYPTFTWPGANFANLAMQSTMLAIEAQQVIALRLTKMAMGGPDVQREAELMVAEKLEALTDAGHVVAKAAIAGQHDMGADKVMQMYRRKVRANMRRLSA